MKTYCGSRHKSRWKPLKLSVLFVSLACSFGTAAHASAGEELDSMMEMKQEAQEDLSRVQENISSLEGKKQELEGYLSSLNAQYEELTQSVAALGEEAAEKEEKLKALRKQLKQARKKEKKQYEAMKQRIVYMYERGKSSWLEQLLSCRDLAQFLNQAENVALLSKYDRDMLKEYEELTKSIAGQEKEIESEAEAVNALLSEKAARQQEVKNLAADTSGSISAYIQEISASQEEAGALMAQVASADNSIAALMLQAEEERAAEEKAAEEQVRQEEEEKPAVDYDPETDTMDSSSSSTSSDVTVEEYYGESSGESSDVWEGDDDEEPAQELYGDSSDSYEDSSEDSYEEDYGESSGEESSDGSQGTYLGTFTLTAYCNCAQCCGTAGNATASGTMPQAGRTVAMGGVPFGTQLLINGNVYTVEDLGTPYGHVDIYCSSHEEALNFGCQTAEVYQLN